MPIAQTRLETLQVCKLLQCVREEDREQIEKLTINGVPHLINYNESGQGDTPLNIAAASNNDAMVEVLLDLGAHTDVVDFQGRAPIMRAAEYGHVQCMEKLAKAGANMKIRDTEGRGVIYYCLSPTDRHRKCLEIALAHGADVNNVWSDGTPEILYACEHAGDNEEMCINLLQKGADTKAKHTKTNRTVLMAAAASGSAKVVRLIFHGKGSEIMNEVMVRPKHTAVHECAKNGHLDVLMMLGAYGCNFDVYDEQLNNPIHLAAMAGHDMCCKFLGQRGCNPKPKNAEGNVPKNLAKDNGHKAAMKEIKKVEKSFGKTGKNNDPWAIALYDFCCEHKDPIVEMFQKFDADGAGVVPQTDFTDSLQGMGAPIPDSDSLWNQLLNQHDKDRQNVVDYNDFLGAKKWINKLFLMSAFEGKKKKKKGGKGKKKKGKTKIPMPICTQPDGPRQADGGPPAVFQPRHIHFTDTGRFDRDRPPMHPLEDDSGWYLHHPEKQYMNVNAASKHSDMDSLKDAFNRGLHVDMRDKYFKTPLMIASLNGNINMVQFLVEKGASVNAEDNFKWTPLHFACHAGMMDIVMYLMDQGANLEARTMNQATPLMRAVESSKPELVQYLIDKGAKVQVENKKGQNPVDIAAAWADLRVYDIVKTKFDSLPAPNDKKKGGKGGKKGGGKSTPVADKPAAHTARPGSPGMDIPPPRQRKGSILRAASALAGGIEEVEDVTYTPKKVWTKQPNTQDLLCERVVRRERFTWEVDFPDFKMPFNKNVANRVEAEGGFSDED